MNPRSAINFFRSTKTGAFILFLAVFGGGFVLVMGFASKGNSVSAVQSENPPREETQIVETITRDMILFDPPREVESEPTPVPYEPETKEENRRGWRPSAFIRRPSDEVAQDSVSEDYAPFGRLIQCELVIMRLQLLGSSPTTCGIMAVDRSSRNRGSRNCAG